MRDVFVVVVSVKGGVSNEVRDRVKDCAGSWVGVMGLGSGL